MPRLYTQLTETGPVLGLGLCLVVYVSSAPGPSTMPINYAHCINGLYGDTRPWTFMRPT